MKTAILFQKAISETPDLAATVNDHNLIVEKIGAVDYGAFIAYKITCSCGEWDMADYHHGTVDGFIRFHHDVPAATCPGTLEKYLTHVVKFSMAPMYNDYTKVVLTK